MHEESNDNGIRVVNFAISKNCIAKNTYFKHKNIHKQTWIFPKRGMRNQIDHVLADKQCHINVLDVRSYRRANCNSDHLIAKIRERLLMNRVSEQSRQTNYLNILSLTEEENGIKFAVKVTNRFAALEEIIDLDYNVMNRQWENIRDDKVDGSHGWFL